MTFVEAEGVRLHWRVEGPQGAPTIVFVNSLGTDLSMWDPQVAALRSSFRVVRHDARGHGASDSPAGPYSIELLGADVLGLLDRLAIDRAHVCGISMGGLVAMWLAATHPERIERAIFASTAVKIGSKDFWNERAQAVEAGGMKAIREVVIQRFLTSSFREASPRMARKVETTLESTPAEGYVASCLAVRDADLTDTVGSIRAPSLIVAGADDVATPPSDAEKLHEHIPGSGLVVLEDASHLCNIEQPERFNQAVLRFLGGGRDEGRRYP
jgi:3-oxoadipate enol-lactonase